MAGRPAILKVGIVADAKGVKQGTDEAESRLSRFAGGIGKHAKLAGAGLAAVGVAAVGMATVVVGAASEAQQASGAVASVYGKHARQVEANAKRAADAVGLSATEYRNMAAIVGSQLKNMGRSQAQSAVQSDKLIRLGSDLAATYGGSVSDAVSAVSSLLRGETDPIERYGVSIKQSDINARLASQGLDKLTGAAAKQAQATAVLGLLTSQTASATGAFGRESNTLAGQQERLKAKFENVKATVGTALLPALTSLFAMANERLFPAIGRVSALFSSRFGPTLHNVGTVLRERVVPAIREFVGWVQDKIVPAVGKYLTAVLEGVRGLFAKVSSAVERNHDRFEQLGKILKTVGEFAAKYVVPVIGKTLGAAFSTFGTIIGTTIDLVGTLLDALETIIDTVGKVGGAIGKVGGFVGKFVPGNAVDLVGDVAGLVGPSSAPSVGPRIAGLATSSTTFGSYTVVPGGSGSRVGASPVVVDRRTVSIRVDGALDPVSTASQIRRLLDAEDARLGRAGGWGVA